MAIGLSAISLPDTEAFRRLHSVFDGQQESSGPYPASKRGTSWSAMFGVHGNSIGGH